MKIAIISGRGIEGCGATKNILEIQKYCTKHGVDYSTIVANDKKFSRGHSQPMVTDVCLPMHLKENIDTMIKEALTCDVALLCSIPAKDVKPEAIENFLTLVCEIKKQMPIAYIQTDHSIQSIRRNAETLEIMKSVDAVLTHSAEGDFAKYIQKNGFNCPVWVYPVGIDFDAQREKYWKPADEVDLKALKFIGRSSGWKNPGLFVDIGRELIKEGYTATLEGMERSISYVSIFYKEGQRKNGFIDKVTDRLYKENAFDKVDSENVYIFGPYVNSECMERVSKTGFTSDLYKLPPQKYGMSLEYCQSEPVGAGSIPILHKHYGDHARYMKGGNLISQDSGTVWYDPENPNAALDYIRQLSSDKKLFDSTREKCFEFWKTHADNEVVHPILIDCLDRLINKKDMTQPGFEEK